MNETLKDGLAAIAGAVLIFIGVLTGFAAFVVTIAAAVHYAELWFPWQR